MDQNIGHTVVGFILKNNLVLLGLRKKVSWGLGTNLVSGIGGKVGDQPEIVNETTEEALVREFKEEIGVVPIEFEDKGKVTFMFPYKPQWSQEVTTFTVSKWQGEPQETEVIKPTWYKKEELPWEQMWDDAKYWTPRVLKGEIINMIITYKEDNKTVDKVIGLEK